MSGPKISIYELSAWQRKNMMAQLKCTQDSLACVEQIKRSINDLNSFSNQIETLRNTISLIHSRTSSCADELITINDIQNSLTQDCSLLMDELLANMPVITDKITLSDDELNEKKMLLAKLKTVQSKAVFYHKKTVKTLSEINEKAQSSVNEIKSRIAEDIASVYSFYIESNHDTTEQFAVLFNKLEEKLTSLAYNTNCPPRIKEDIGEALCALKKITSIEHLNTFNAVTVIPLLRRYDDILEQQQQGDSFDELTARYSALCAIAQTTQKYFLADEMGVESLRLEIASLEKQIVLQTEQVYISDCVNEVMTEMGYDLIGNRSVTKRSGKRFENKLFSYSDGTAINVTYDSEGQIAMELGGIDRTDRMPTSDETDALCEDMASFCKDFKVFEESLKAKGVSMKSRVSISPPIAEYATIINVEDYNITTVKPIANMTVKNRRRKSVAKQPLRKEGN